MATAFQLAVKLVSEISVALTATGASMVVGTAALVLVAITFEFTEISVPSVARTL